MGLKQQLQKDLKDALRARDEHRKSVIRMCLAEIVNAEVEHRGELDDTGVLAVLSYGNTRSASSRCAAMGCTTNRSLSP